MYCLLVLLLISSAPSVFSGDCKSESCKPGETCCPTGFPDDHTCCPLENAVCCEDHTHCCPQGSQCDITTGLCTPQDGEQNKMGSINKLEKRVGTTYEEAFSNDCEPEACKSGETCCPSSTGGYNCCPYSNAICCEGNAFCCPENYECNIAEGVCSPKETIAVEGQEVDLLEEGNVKLTCNDGSICPPANTCCTVAGGKKFGCCPHLNATCCADKIHCCPQGQACDVTSRYCVGKQSVHESAVKDPALPIHFEDSA